MIYRRDFLTFFSENDLKKLPKKKWFFYKGNPEVVFCFFGKKNKNLCVFGGYNNKTKKVFPVFFSVGNKKII